MYTLSFDPSDRKYERIYAALVTRETTRDRAEVKATGGALDKLERIGVVLPAQTEKGDPRPHKRGELKMYETVLGGTVQLENAEFAVVKSAFLDNVAKFHPSLSRETEAVAVWLEELKEDVLDADRHPGH